VLIVDDEEVLAATLREFLADEGFDVATAGDATTALDLAARFEPDIALCDIQLPGADGLEVLDGLLRVRPETMVVMITAFGTIESAVAAFRKGAQDYLLKPVIFDELLAKVDRLIAFRGALRDNQALRRQLHASAGAGRLVGRGAAMRGVRALVEKVGPTKSHVLIVGDSGAGKEVVARALHDEGGDPKAPFLAVNCAAIPEGLVESELFGHVKGAFTGADRDRAGLFVAAGRGTAFLDEIGEASPASQAKLLRAIESREVLPVGASRAVPFSARVVAATNQDLPAEVAAGRFRADLYYRLNVVTIKLPPLRDRPEDIPDLVLTFLDRFGPRLGKRVLGVDDAAMRRLLAHPWPGNVRELENRIEMAIVLGDGPVLTAADLFPQQPDLDAVADSDDLRAALARFERGHIARVLDACAGDKREAARRLGLGLSTLYRKLDEAGPC
jgi:DNA-binding NtrC family response regulator